MTTTIQENLNQLDVFARTTQDDHESAKEKAWQLLRQTITESEWKKYEAKEIIRLTGKRGIYIISPYSTTKIRSPSSGRCIAYACLQLIIPAPICDRIVAEYILIKNDEEKYWKTANIFFWNEIEFEITTLFLIGFNIFLFVNLLLKLL